MNPELALSVGVMLGPGGLWMLQNAARRSAAPPLADGALDDGERRRRSDVDELWERLALLERFATDRPGAGPAKRSDTREDGRK